MTKIVLVALLMSLMAVIVGLSIQEQAQANIWHDLGDGVDNYREGKQEGKDAGARGEDSSCPSNSIAYCLGWNSGYYDGQKSREDVEEAYDDDEDDNDDD